MFIIITVIILALACKLSLKKAKQPRTIDGRWSKCLPAKIKFQKKVEEVEFYEDINPLFS